MSRKYAQNKNIDRSLWEAGPWDNEPDFHEWTTVAGYPAYMARLDSGVWYSVVEAPHPMGWNFSKFCHALSEMRKGAASPGAVIKTDQINVGGFSLSFERWKSPGPNDKNYFIGEYKSLEEVMEITESLAQDLLKLNNDPNLYSKALEMPEMNGE